MNPWRTELDLIRAEQSADHRPRAQVIDLRAEAQSDLRRGIAEARAKADYVNELSARLIVTKAKIAFFESLVGDGVCMAHDYLNALMDQVRLQRALDEERGVRR